MHFADTWLLSSSDLASFEDRGEKEAFAENVDDAEVLELYGHRLVLPSLKRSAQDLKDDKLLTAFDWFELFVLLFNFELNVSFLSLLPSLSYIVST